MIFGGGKVWVMSLISCRFEGRNNLSFGSLFLPLYYYLQAEMATSKHSHDTSSLVSLTVLEAMERCIREGSLICKRGKKLS